MKNYGDFGVISFDLIGTIVRRDFVDDFWEHVIPNAVARERGWCLGKARKWVFSEYKTISIRDIRWHMPSYWVSRFKLPDDRRGLIRRSMAQLRMYEDAKAALPRISRERKIIITTNVSRDFLVPALQRIRIRFDATYSAISDYSLPLKPPEFYLKVLDDFDADPKTVLHIGDDPIQDFRNPKKAGLEALLLARGRSCPTTDCIRNLKALEKLISRGKSRAIGS